ETVLMDGRTGTRSGRLLAIRKAIDQSRADIVVPSDMIDAFDVVATTKATRRGAPRLVCGLTGFHPDYMAMIKWYAPTIDYAFGVSTLTARALIDLCDIPPERVAAIPTGVAPAIVKWKDRKSGPIRLAYIGRLVADKRPLDIPLLSKQLHDRGVPHVIHVYGEGELKSELAASASDAVHLHGPISPERLYTHVYPNLDAALIFSPAEGNPNALMEAMANGVVPVCSDYAGRFEQGIIRNGETGLVFPVGDLSTAARHIQSLASDKNLRTRLASTARHEIAAKHSLSAMGDAFVDMLNHTLTAEPRVASINLDRGRPRSRLESLFGARIAETIRRSVRYRYPHHDLEEWPSTEVFRGQREIAIKNRLLQWLQ